MIGSRVGAQPGIIPLGRDDALRFLPLVVALLVYVAALAGIGLALVDDVVRGSERSLATRLTVQVPAEASNARLQTILALLRQTPGIVTAQLLTPAETALLLEPWLGSAAPFDELPVPRLVDLTIDPNSTPDLAALRQRLTSVVPDARLDDHRPGLDRVVATVRPLQGLLVVAIGVSLLSIAVLAAFATRATLTARRSAIELVHLLGAADRDIARPLAVRSLRLSLWGSAIGSVAVLITLIAMRGTGGILQLPVPTAAIGVADWRLWAVLIGIAIAAGLVAMASARWSVMRRLAELP